MVAPGPLVPAATLHFDNFNFALDGTELLLVDNAGNPLITGFVALYQFGNPASAPSDFASLRSNGGGGLLNLVEISAANSPGGIGVLVTPLSAFNSNGELRDLQLYVVVGNGGSVAVSTQLAMLNTRIAFSTSDVPEVQQVFYSANATDIVVGQTGQQTVNGGPGVGEWDARTLVLVPEPTSTLLFLVSVFTLLRRRR